MSRTRIIGFYNSEGIIVLLDRLAAHPGCDVLIEKIYYRNEECNVEEGARVD